MSELNWCRLDNTGLLRFEGPDTRAFLHGQLTGDVDSLTPAASRYSGYCTPKGRLLASLLMWQRDGVYYLMLPRELAEPIRKRLSMYILRAKAKVTDVTSEHVLFGTFGDHAAAAIASIAGGVPASVHAVTHAATVSVLKLPVDRYLIVAAVTKADKVQEALQKAGAAAPAVLWQQLDIEAGIPTVVAATQEQFVPQTVNFDAIGAVSFDKGCYPGQEIVARMHYLGKLKQRMVRARIVSAETPLAGDKLYSATFGDQASGMIVSAAAARTGAPDTHEVLAVVQAGASSDADVHWKTPDGPALALLPLPYTVK